MTPKEEINKLVEQAYATIAKAEEIADEHGLSFSFDLTYGMGGTYEGQMSKERALQLLESGTELTSNQKAAIETAIENDGEYLDEYGEESNGWHASSQSC